MGILRDLRYAIGSLRRALGFVALTVACLGLGLGIVATVFAVLDAVVRPHLPYHDADRLFEVSMRGDGASRQIGSFEMLAALRAHSERLGWMAVTEWLQSGAPIEVRGQLVEGRVALVDRSYFRVFGIRLRMGRPFAPGDAEQAAILTSSFWDQHFTGQALADARITVRGRTLLVVGVLPPGARHPVAKGVLLFQDTISGAPATLEGSVIPFVRLAQGADSASAARGLSFVASELVAEYGVGATPFDYSLRTVRSDPFSLQPIHGALAAGAMAVLLIACANVANLLLARGLAKRRDIAIRIAMGATRAAIVRQLLAEALLVALSGGAIGVLVTLWSATALRGAVPPTLGVADGVLLQPQISWRVLAVAMASAVLSALVCGVGPAVRASDVRANEALKESSGATTARRSSYNGIVVMELAVTLVLMVGAGLMVRSVLLVRNHAFAEVARGLIHGRVNVWNHDGHAWVSATPPTTQLLSVVGTVPGVQAAAIETEGCPWGTVVLAEGGEQELVPSCLRVSHGYLRVRGLRLIAGRDFSPGDAGAAGALILDSGLAHKLWRDGEAVGRFVKLGMGHRSAERSGGRAASANWTRVVGVVAAHPHFDPADPEEPPRPMVIAVEPIEQLPAQFLVRTHRGHEAIVASRLTEIVRSQLVGRLLSLAFEPSIASFDDLRIRRRFVGRVFLWLSLLALSLAMTGLFAVVSQAVSRRLREFAIRIALGASATDIVRLGIRDAAVMVLAGTGVGAFGALWAGRYVGPWLYGIDPVDGLSLVTAEALLLISAAAATLLAIRRALRVDPVEAIRST